jgi:spore coat polysaccharide biosynthesis protein SpsF
MTATPAREPGDPSRRVVAIVQARMGSKRLPGKVLADVGGAPMLARVVERARRAALVHQVAVATSIDPADDAVVDMCRGRGICVMRGSASDVLDRFYQAAVSHAADVVVRLTGDCPLIDPGLIDEAVAAFLQADPPFDLVANRLPQGRDVPIGLDVEVCSMQALTRAWLEADQPYQREHVLPYLYDTPGRFRVFLLRREPSYGTLRWTVDTAEDLEVVRRIYASFPGRDDFGWLDVLEVYQLDPALRAINAGVNHKTYTDVG